jgi:hypothetical protein
MMEAAEGRRTRASDSIPDPQDRRSRPARFQPAEEDAAADAPIGDQTA